jgi:type II secretion system protein C
MAGLSLSSHSLDPDKLLERLTTSRWTPILVTLTALVLLSYSLAQWTWRLMAPAGTAPRTPVAATSPSQDNAAMLRDLLATNLFGVAQPGTGGFSPDALPATSLNLVLTGVMVRGKDSFALLRIEGGDETPVRVGEEILAGARLYAVYPDKAVLWRGGSYESVLLKETATALPSGAIVASGARNRTGYADVVRGSGNQFAVNRDSMKQQMQRPEFLSQALVVPNAGGGFLVREVQPGSLYEKLGVNVGDVIRSVNGSPVNNMDDVMKLYQQLGGLEQAGNVSLEVTRDGRPEHLHYQLN